MSKVSVIVPNYNHAPYLRERIESVLAQDYPDYEVILLDDCSTDDSRTILDAYRHHPKVRAVVYNTTNSGSTFIQWRRGLEMAEGDYVWIAESDDIAAPTFLSTLVPHLDRAPHTVLAYAASRWIDCDGRPIARTTTHRWRHDHCYGGADFVRSYLLGYCYICNASAVVMRREAALRVSDRCTRYRASGDRQFWIEMALQGDVQYLSAPLNSFRQHHCKVSGPAEQRGQNIVEDHLIYGDTTRVLPLSRWQRCCICGYHMQAIRHGRVSHEGRLTALREWQSEPEFTTLSHLIYLFTRILDRCRFY